MFQILFFKLLNYSCHLRIWTTANQNKIRSLTEKICMHSLEIDNLKELRRRIRIERWVNKRFSESLKFAEEEIEVARAKGRSFAFVYSFEEPHNSCFESDIEKSEKMLILGERIECVLKKRGFQTQRFSQKVTNIIAGGSLYGSAACVYTRQTVFWVSL